MYKNWWKVNLGDFSRGDPYDYHSSYEEQSSLVSPTTHQWKEAENEKWNPDGGNCRKCRDPHVSASARSQNHPSIHQFVNPVIIRS